MTWSTTLFLEVERKIAQFLDSKKVCEERAKIEIMKLTLILVVRAQKFLSKAGSNKQQRRKEFNLAICRIFPCDFCLTKGGIPHVISFEMQMQGHSPGFQARKIRAFYNFGMP